MLFKCRGGNVCSNVEVVMFVRISKVRFVPMSRW